MSFILLIGGKGIKILYPYQIISCYMYLLIDISIMCLNLLVGGKGSEILYPYPKCIYVLIIYYSYHESHQL